MNGVRNKNKHKFLLTIESNLNPDELIEADILAILNRGFYAYFKDDVYTEILKTMKFHVKLIPGYQVL